MVDHSNIWQYKVRISGRLVKDPSDPDSMTEEHLKAFLAMPRADLDRIFKTPESEGVTTTEEVSQSYRIPSWGLKSDP